MIWDPVSETDPRSSRYFQNLELNQVPEVGRHLLTDAIRARFSDYSEEELTTRELIFVLRKKAP